MTQNIDQNEVNKFAEIAENWWDPTGDFKPLHVINPLRANYIDSKSSLKNLKVLDVGCGGGLLAEALNAKGAHVTGIDVTEANIEVARYMQQKWNQILPTNLSLLKKWLKQSQKVLMWLHA